MAINFNTNGKDGFSPIVEVTDIPGGHRITITDESGPHSFDVMDGNNSGGTSDYSALENKPQINGVELSGNKTHNELAIRALDRAEDVKPYGFENYTVFYGSINNAGAWGFAYDSKYKRFVFIDSIMDLSTSSQTQYRLITETGLEEVVAELFKSVNVANTEPFSVAANSYEVGDYVLHKTSAYAPLLLWRVTKAITVGDTIYSTGANQNIEQVTLGSELKRIEKSGSGGSIDVDTAMSDTSENPVQNKVITAEVESLDLRIIDLADEMTGAKTSIAKLDTSIGNMSSLSTSAKTTIVEAINEIANKGGGGTGNANFDIGTVPLGGAGVYEVNAFLSNNDSERVRAIYSRGVNGEIPDWFSMSVTSGLGTDDFHVATKEYADEKAAQAQSTAQTYTDLKLTQKQDKLTSGTNIKTVNGNSLLGAGNLNVGVNIEVNKEKWYGTYTDENGVTYQVYSKMIYIPALPSTAGITAYDHGISGIKQILQVYGFTADGFVLNAPRQNAQDNIAIYQMSKSASNKTLSIEVGKDRSSKSAYVVVVYAKNN